MVGRIILGTKRYSLREYLHVAMITGGIAVFFLFEQVGFLLLSSCILPILFIPSIILDSLTPYFFISLFYILNI